MYEFIKLPDPKWTKSKIEAQLKNDSKELEYRIRLIY
jgi:hypothetical protein